MGGSRKRRHSPDVEEIDSEKEDQEEGELSEESGEDTREIRRQRSHEHKKSKKKKKDKKKKKKKRRRRSSSASESDGSRGHDKSAEVIDVDQGSTDFEGGSTPEAAPVRSRRSDDEEGQLEDSDGERRRSRREKKKRHRRHRSRSISEDDSHEPRHRDESRERRRYDERDDRDVKYREEAHSPTESEVKSSREVSRRSEKSRHEKRKRSVSPIMKRVESDEEKSFGNSSGGAVVSMSVEETNKLRAKLGLKPLNVGSNAPQNTEEDNDDGQDGTLIPNTNVRHKPAENLTEKSHIEKMRERLQQRRIKRLQEAKLHNIKTLAESDSDEDSAASWVKRQKKKEKERKEAEKRAKMLEDLDDEFGIGSIIEEETKKDVQKKYGKTDLRGLRVEHAAHRFKEGESIILTLKDSDVLDESAGDALINVNLMDTERVEKNLKNLRDAKAGGYNPYEEDIDPVTGDLVKKGLLSKYDEEIAGKETKKSFHLGEGGQFDEEESLRQERERIRQKLNKRLVESLDVPAPRIASDFMTEEEATVKFKKVKKKKKVKRKMLKADDLLPLDEDEPRGEKPERTTLPMDVDMDDVGEVQDLTDVKVDDEDDLGLQKALARTRRLKQLAREEDSGAKKIAEIAATLPKEEEIVSGTTGAEFIGTFADDKSSNRNIILNETSEFCRHLGAWRSSEMSGMGESVSKDILEFETSLKSRSDSKRGRWAALEDEGGSESDDSDADRREARNKKGEPGSTTILDEEPDLNRGVMAAIQLASTKGYLDTKEKEVKASNLEHLMAKNYSIDDKMRDDDRSSRRERYSGPTQPFAEKSNYVPNVQLDYVDEHGRQMNSKEAFRYLSHRFHGKGSGKMKTEKRMKKIMEEAMMKSMSSTDTPLQTLEKLRERQKESATPYLVLTGNKLNPTDVRK